MASLENLILTARPGSRAIRMEHVVAIWSALEHHPHRIKQKWLSENEAWQAVVMFRDPEDARQVRSKAETVVAGLPVDVNVTNDFDTFDTLFVADMESTIIEQEMIDELADYVGLRAKISEITARAMRGELDFEASLRERVAMLAGLEARVLDEVYDKRVTLMPGAEALIRTMKAHGAYCALVSGGFTVFTERVARRLGFDEHQANVLEIANGRLTGRVREPILGRAAKRAALERIAADRGLDLSETIAVGDGANDLDMLAAATIGVAFRAKPKVQEAVHAMANGAVINHSDLTALLYLQGYRNDEFAT